jgi:hypothetical protein
MTQTMCDMRCVKYVLERSTGQSRVPERLQAMQVMLAKVHRWMSYGSRTTFLKPAFINHGDTVEWRRYACL